MMGGRKLEQQWWTDFAADSTLPNSLRAEAVQLIDNDSASCMHGGIPDRLPPPGYVYVEPVDEMVKCARAGLELIDLALQLDTTSFRAWYRKADLLTRLAELSDKAGRNGEATEYRRQQILAKAEGERWLEEFRAKIEAARKPR